MRTCLIGLTALVCLAVVASAQPRMDGSASDPLYGALIASQDTLTGFGDSNLGQPDVANGSELDAVYGVVYNGYLYLMFAGNFETNGNKLEIFFDTRAGGQNRLLATNPGTPNTGLLRMSDDGSGNGLRFTSGFEADFWVSVNAYGDPTNLYVDYAELYRDAGNPGVLYYCGAGLPKCSTVGGALTGGDVGAPTLLVTVDNSNVLGVTGGSDPDLSGAADLVTTGMEVGIPLAALGNPTGSIGIIAFINGQQHDFISNQVLGGLFGSANLGEPRAVNFATTAAYPFYVPATGAAVGACCTGTTCAIKTQAQCGGGTFLGINSSCAGNPCSGTPIGRCCINDGYSGTCLILTQTQCTSQGGTYGGNGTTCEGCPCLLPRTGACCIGGVCSVKSQAECTAQSGVYAGNFVACTADTCTPGACCVELVCSLGTQFQCTALGGRFIGVGTNCTTNPCAAPTLTDPHIAGDWNWDPGATPMVETAPGSKIYTHTLTGLVAGSRHEFKVTNGNWGPPGPIPGGPNSWFYAGDDGTVTVTYDANYYADGWLPSRDRLGLNTDSGTWTAAGTFQSLIGGGNWDPANPNTLMTSQGSGQFKLTFTGAPAADYQWKAVKTGTWDSISTDTRSVNTANATFTTASSGDTVSLWVDNARGCVKVDIVPAGPTRCRGDANCDGFINFADIDLFVAAIPDNQAAWAALFQARYGHAPTCPFLNSDCNNPPLGDGHVNFADIDPFVALIPSACP